MGCNNCNDNANSTSSEIANFFKHCVRVPVGDEQGVWVLAFTDDLKLVRIPVSIEDASDIQIIDEADNFEGATVEDVLAELAERINNVSAGTFYQETKAYVAGVDFTITHNLGSTAYQVQIDFGMTQMATVSSSNTTHVFSPSVGGTSVFRFFKL